MKRTCIIISATVLAGALSCSKWHDEEPARAVELAIVEESVVIPEDGGTVSVQCYANGRGTLRLLDEAEWLSVGSSEISGDCSLGLDAQSNSGGRRRGARLLLSSPSDSRSDTLFVLQEGTPDVFEAQFSSVVVYNAMGDTYIPLTSNVDPSRISSSVRYVDGEGTDWVQGLSITPKALIIRTGDNPSDSEIRRAVLKLSWTDGWLFRDSLLVNLNQATSAASGNRIGSRTDFGELRSLVNGSAPLVINDALYIEGIVVSDPASGNVTENPQSTSTLIDYTMTDRCAVLESLDGKYGFLLEFLSEADNVLSCCDRASILLQGAQVRRYENPERYVISNLRADRVASAYQAGGQSVPVKRIRIADLTDADIYTHVTLTDCEFPIRKGSLTPINEGYSMLYGSDRMTKFPTLVRDKDGSSLYVYTNSTCPYRRDGTRMGYGSGTLSGIVVHEKYRSFVDGDAASEEDCGNIGRYQIRHQSREDFAFADSFEDSFSALLCEWRWLPEGNADHSWSATEGVGTMTHTYQGGNPSPDFGTWCYPVYDFSYLGPCFRGCTNENGFGIILPDGSDYPPYTGEIEKGQLSRTVDNPLAWMKERWKDSSKYCSWEIHFSTVGISTDRLSLQISTLNASQEARSPVHWKVEWSVSNDAAASWTHIANYTVPDVVLWTITQPWQSCGFKPIDFELPLEMLGEENVYIRLTPADNAGNSKQGYCDTTFKNGTEGSSSKANNALNYVAIRYNK